MKMSHEEFMEGVRDLRRPEYPKTHWGLTVNSPEEDEALLKSLKEALRPLVELEESGYRIPARGSAAVEAAYMTAFED